MDGPEKSAAAADAKSLPDDSLVGIFSCVPAKSLGRFKCASKAWRDLIADRLRCRKFPQTLEGFFYGGRGQNNGNFINLVGKSVPLVDPSFSFLTKAPGVEDLVILSSHNGLLLIGHNSICGSGTYGYIVCNPATEQWVAVPCSGWPVSLPAEKCKGDEVSLGEDEKSQDDDERSDEDGESNEDDEESDDDDEESDEDDLGTGAHHFLIFDPAVSSHFHLVQLGHYTRDEMLFDVNVYSSETGLWSCKTQAWAQNVEGGGYKRWMHGDDKVKFELGSAYVNGMQHIPVYHYYYHDRLNTKETQIVAVDVQGNICRVMCWPDENEIASPAFIGQSQGCLHCISGHQKPEDPNGHIIGLSIWVLKDYDAGHWVPKQSVSSLQLFGKLSCKENDFAVVAFHPDQNSVFFVQHWNQKLIAYDMDSMEVRALCTLGHDISSVIPYVPYFADLSVLTKKHRNCCLWDDPQNGHLEVANLSLDESLSGVGILEVANLSLDEPELQAVSFGDAEVASSVEVIEDEEE